MKTISKTEIVQLKEEFLSEIKSFSPELVEAGHILLNCIAAPSYIVQEWSLPRWVGDLFGLPTEVTWKLIFSNVCGLAFVRITDDLADGDYRPTSSHSQKSGSKKRDSSDQLMTENTKKKVKKSELQDSILLGAALHHIWMMQYHHLFSEIQMGDQASDVSAARFWKYFNKYMGQWFRASSNRCQHIKRPFHSFTESDFMRLAERGAPLKICCAAACLIAGREGDIDLITSAVDQLMVGCILLDHIWDWKEDLDGNRYNTFVAYCSDLPQTEDMQEDNRKAVLKKIYLSKGAHPYFHLILERLNRSRKISRKVGCLELIEFITGFEKDIYSWSNWFKNVAESRIRTVMDTFVSPRTTEGS